MTFDPVGEPVASIRDMFEGITCTDDACTGPACPDRTCWLREGYRLAVDVAREAADQDGAPGWLPARICDAAAWLVPGWEVAGTEYQVGTEEVPATVQWGEVWTVCGGDYAHKPRPAVVVQNGAFRALGSVTVCPLTTHPTQAPVRVAVEPSAGNGLEHLSYVMVDKITTIPRSKVHRRLGALSDADLARVDSALLAYLHGVT